MPTTSWAWHFWYQGPPVPGTGLECLALARILRLGSGGRNASMLKAIYIALLIAGVILIVFGINAATSFSSDVSRTFTGSPTNKAIMMLVGGVVASLIGIVGLLRKPR